MTTRMLEQNFHMLQRLIEDRQKFESQFSDAQSPYVKYKTDINYADVNGNTLLHYAAALGNLTKVQQYITDKAINIDAINHERSTAINLALAYGHINVAQSLYEQGAHCKRLTLNACTDSACRQWLHSMMQATVSELSQLNYSQVNSIARNKSVFRENNFFKNKNSGSMKDWLSDLLKIATEINDFARINTIFHQWQLVCEIPTREADIALWSKLLLVAARAGHIELCKFFIARGAPLNPEEFYGDTALTTASQYNQLAVIEYLLQQRADVNRQTIRKQTALMLAVCQNHVTCAQKLLMHNTDLNLKDIDGNTVLHHAAQSANTELLELLCKQSGIKELLAVNNRYGYTPLDLAIQHKNDAAILLFAPNAELTIIQQGKYYSCIPVKTNQRPVLNRLRYFFRQQYLSQEFFPSTGHCNGFEYLFHYYSIRGMPDYYFNTKALTATWDGTEEPLFKEFSADMPQRKYHKNLYELMLQWANDLIWFQHNEAIGKFSQLKHSDRVEQYSHVKTIGDDYDPIFLYRENIITINQAQLGELLQYLCRMPVNVHFEFTGGEHATGGMLSDQNKLLYDDTNFPYLAIPMHNPSELLQAIIDYKYIAIKKYKEKFEIDFRIFYAKKDLAHANLKKFSIFTEKEIPHSAEEAYTFQQQSASKFTHLHIAILTNSISCVQQLLSDGYADVNAIDAFRRSSFELAINTGNKTLITLLLDSKALTLDKERINTLTVQLYDAEHHELLTFLIDTLPKELLVALSFAAIKKNDLSLVKTLIIDKKMQVNYSYEFHIAVPLAGAIKANAEQVFDFLLQQGAAVLYTDGMWNCINWEDVFQPSLIRHHGKYYYKLIEQNVHLINTVDDKGDFAIHIAATYADISIFKDLLARGADVNLKDTFFQKSVLAALRNGWARQDTNYPELRKDKMKLVLPQTTFNFSNEADRSLLWNMLAAELTDSSGVDLPFFKDILKKCCRNVQILDFVPDNHETLLYRAMTTNHPVEFKLLLEGGCNPNTLTPKGNPLLVSILSYLQMPPDADDNQEAIYQMLDTLLAHHADIDLAGFAGKTALELAQLSSDPQIQNSFAAYTVSTQNHVSLKF